jgi:hypothetical protein
MWTILTSNEYGRMTVTDLMEGKWKNLLALYWHPSSGNRKDIENLQSIHPKSKPCTFQIGITTGIAATPGRPVPSVQYNFISCQHVTQRRMDHVNANIEHMKLRFLALYVTGSENADFNKAIFFITEIRERILVHNRKRVFRTESR